MLACRNKVFKSSDEDLMGGSRHYMTECSPWGKEMGSNLEVVDTEWQMTPNVYPVPKEHKLIKVLSAQ